MNKTFIYSDHCILDIYATGKICLIFIFDIRYKDGLSRTHVCFCNVVAVKANKEYGVNQPPLFQQIDCLHKQKYRYEICDKNKTVLKLILQRMLVNAFGIKPF
jgi:hypothetical protein